MSLTERVIKDLHDRRNTVLSGNINCIPSPLSRFRQDFVGIEQGRYYLITANTKVGKSQLMNYLFLYNSILYSYNNPNKLSVKILYYNLEEKPENIILRFMSYLLYTLPEYKYRCTPQDLRSTNEGKIVDEDILKALEDKKIQDILEYFERVVDFIPDKNPHGIYRQIRTYAENNGTTHYKKLDIKNSNGDIIETRDVFDYYEASNKKEYVLIIIDHISLISPEQKHKDLREAIVALSDYLITVRNRYNYIPVVVQQQGVETSNLEAYKSNKIRPTVAGLADCRYTSKDCDIMLGLTNPYTFEIPEYCGYNLKDYLKNNARFLEVIINRNGNSNGMIGLYFDGGVNYYRELPPPNTPELTQFYNNLVKIRSKLFLMIDKFVKKIKK